MSVLSLPSTNLKHLDVSFNTLANISPEIHSLEQLRTSRGLRTRGNAHLIVPARPEHRRTPKVDERKMDREVYFIQWLSYLTVALLVQALCYGLDISYLADTASPADRLPVDLGAPKGQWSQIF